jgi:hypothetical protein
VSHFLFKKKRPTYFWFFFSRGNFIPPHPSPFQLHSIFHDRLCGRGYMPARRSRANRVAHV